MTQHNYEQLATDIQQMRTRLDRLEVKFDTYIKHIDEQHRDLKDHINSFFGWLKENDEKLVTKEMCNKVHRDAENRINEHLQAHEHFRRGIIYPLAGKVAGWVVSAALAAYILLSKGGV